MTLVSQCFSCKHYKAVERPDTAACSAFPNGIPEDILFNDFDHRTPHAGDHAIQWEPRTKKDLVYRDAPWRNPDPNVKV